MTRYHIVTSANGGEAQEVAFSPEEEEAADAADAAPTYPRLEKWRVWAIAEIAGLDVLGAIDGLSDPTAKAVAKAKWNDPPGGFFDRDDPLFSNAALLAALNVDSDNIDTLWTQAAGLT